MLEWDISYADACFLCCCFGCFSLFWGGKPRLAADSLGRRAVEGVRRAGRAAGARCAGAARSKPGFFPRSSRCILREPGMPRACGIEQCVEMF